MQEKSILISIMISSEREILPYPQPQINEQNETFRRWVINEFIIDEEHREEKGL